AVARNLYHKKTGIVAIIIPEISHPYFAEFVNAAEISLFRYGYQSMICNTWKENNNEAHYVELLKQQRVDGIITGVHTLDIKHYQELDRPIVALDRQISANIPCVAVNHGEGGRYAAQALIQSGCRKVYQQCGLTSVSTPSNIRHEVFERVMLENGIECISTPMKWNSFSYSDYQAAADEIADTYTDIDGIFVTDVMAAALIRSLQERGRRYPEDFKVVAYDGTYVSRMIYPSLTTIEQPITELADTCVDLLMARIQGSPVSEMNVRLDVRFRQGESTAKVMI
ncbi:MAG: substrate-binding domain-containing protein, partial [Lachnospiraceae bacterium]|nr:substrate-binding domain-containing protein [Lachnospiraceae bacterium]